MSINRVTISGNLTRNSELKATPDGTPVLVFCIAVNDRKKNNQTGQWEEYPNYIDCVIYGQRGQSLAQYLEKGTKVIIDGKLRWRHWETNGESRNKIEVVVNEIDFMTRKSNATEGQRFANSGNSSQQPMGQQGIANSGQYVAPQSQPVQVSQAAQQFISQAPVQVQSAYDEQIPF